MKRVINLCSIASMLFELHIFRDTCSIYVLFLIFWRGSVLLTEGISIMPKGQERAWKDFWKMEKNKRNKQKLKGTKEKLKKKFERSPFQCSICHNPRGGRKSCYLCNEEESVVEQDWIMSHKEIAKAQKERARKRKYQRNTLTQMMWMIMFEWN